MNIIELSRLFAQHFLDRRMNMDMNELPLAYAFVPPQKTFNTYTPEVALECGTLFPELNLPMCEYLRGVKEDKCHGR